jgi:hypothetical protein
MTAAERRDKLRKLQALADNPGTEAEGKAARLAMERVMATEPEPERYTSGPSLFDELAKEGNFRTTGSCDFFANFDSALFRQAMRDAAEAMRQAGQKLQEDAYYSGFGYSRAEDDWHAQQRREADERIRQSQAADESRKRASTASTTTGQFHTSFADAVEEASRTGESLAQVFERRKQEWILSKRVEEWAKRGNPLFPHGADFAPKGRKK